MRHRAVVEVIPFFQVLVISVSCVMPSMQTSIMIRHRIEIVEDWIWGIFNSDILYVVSQIESFGWEVNKVTHLLL